MSRVKSDFLDVKHKYQALIDDAEGTKLSLENAERKLADMSHKQLNKLEIAYKSLIKALEVKKKEFIANIRDFYADQR